MGLCVLDAQADLPLVRLPVSRAALVRLAACPSPTRRAAPPRAHPPHPLQTQHDGLPFGARTRRAPGRSSLALIVGLRDFCVCGEESPFPSTQQLCKLLPCPRGGTPGGFTRAVPPPGLWPTEGCWWCGQVLCCIQDEGRTPVFALSLVEERDS